MENQTDKVTDGTNIISDYEYTEQREELNESNRFTFVGNLSECAVNTKRERDMIYVRPTEKEVSWNSLLNPQTLDSKTTIEMVLKECGLEENQVYAYTQYDDQTIADYIIYYLPMTKSIEENNEIFKNLDKIMTSCNYCIATAPEIIKDEHGEDYMLQYEPTELDYLNTFFPKKLHYLTSVSNSKKIQEEGFIPKCNDVFKEKPRIYFFKCVGSHANISLIRNHRKELLNKETEQLEYVDITINVPKDVKFYINFSTEYRLSAGDAVFTFDTIPPEYIESIELKHFGKLMDYLKR